MYQLYPELFGNTRVACGSLRHNALLALLWISDYARLHIGTRTKLICVPRDWSSLHFCFIAIIASLAVSIIHCRYLLKYMFPIGSWGWMTWDMLLSKENGVLWATYTDRYLPWFSCTPYWLTSSLTRSAYQKIFNSNNPIKPIKFAFVWCTCCIWFLV